MAQYSHTISSAGAIFALHSSASNRSQWKELKELTGNGFVFKAPNLPGYGTSPVIPNHELTGIASIAEPIIKEIEAVNHPVHLVGHSQGGAVAIKISLMRPDLLKSLTLYEPAAFHFLKNGTALDRAMFSEINQVSGVLSAASVSGRPDVGMMQFIDFWNGAGQWRQMADEQHRKFAEQATVVMSDFRRGLEETWTLDDLAKINVPTLMMTGLNSPAVAQHTAARISDAIPSAEVVMLPNHGHMAPLFQPAEVNGHIRQHICNVERSAVWEAGQYLSAA